jgi:hypothetical protein
VLVAAELNSCLLLEGKEKLEPSRWVRVMVD